MGVEFFDCAQNSEEWKRLRCGIPTASEFSSILAKGDGKTRRSYMHRLAGEIITGQPAETYESLDMLRGREMEQQAMSMYSFEYDIECKRVGFARNGRVGASPDALIGDRGLLEIKTKKAALLIECILRDEFPPEHKAQVQGQLWVCNFEWCDIAVFWPGMPLFVKRSYRDEPYIAELARAVSLFNAEVDMVVDKIRAFEKRAA